jgi:ribosomal protein S18 acetylase RimI-like enzyme
MMGNKTSDLLAAMEANFLAYFIISLAPLPHMQLYSDPELTWTVSSKSPSWNTVLHTRLAAETAAVRVGAMLDRFKTSNSSLGWLVLPSTRPVNLASYLLANGMKQVENRPHMLADLQKLPAHLHRAEGLKRTPPGLTIEFVHDDASFARWYQATVAGFEMTPSHAQIYYDAYTRLGSDPAGPFLHYVGYLDGEPVTSSTLLLAENMAGIYDVSTAPAARGRGLGTAITLAPLLEAQARGYRYSCLQSSTKGFNVYRRLGFETQYHEKIFAL